MTPWLSFWATPVIGHNQQGETVVLCTLNGLQRVVVPTTESAQLKDVDLYLDSTLTVKADAQNQQYCPALQLVKAFSQGLLTAPIATPSPYPSNTLAPDGHYVFHTTDAFNAYRGRAPPFS